MLWYTVVCLRSDQAVGIYWPSLFFFSLWRAWQDIFFDAVHCLNPYCTSIRYLFIIYGCGESGPWRSDLQFHATGRVRPQSGLINSLIAPQVSRGCFRLFQSGPSQPGRRQKQPLASDISKAHLYRPKASKKGSETVLNMHSQIIFNVCVCPWD